MKLEELLGEELYSKVKAKIDEVNSKETDKLKHVKFTDLSEGSYVKKEKYNLLETEKASVADRLDKANKLIEELKKDNKGNEEMQGKINTYEQEKAALQQELSALPSVKLDIESVARDCGNPRGANMVLLGMAAPFIGILSVEELRQAIATVFARKGDQVVEANLKAFDAGVKAGA